MTTNNQNKNFKHFDEYLAEAEAPPFELPVSEDKTLYFDAPTGARLEHFARGWREGDETTVLYALAGDQWPELEKLTANVHWKVRQQIVADMVKHFGLAPENGEVELRGPGGGTITETDPDRIRQLQQLGFTVVGESQPR